MPTERVPFYAPWITDEDKRAVLQALDSRWLTSGPNVAKFEESFAEYVNVKHAVAVNNGTAALHLVMRALNVGPGDEVIVPVFTFAATANAVLYCGAKPIFADIQESSFNISPKDVENKITRRTKAIVAVHYAGQPCDVREMQQIAADSKLSLVEDCAHSLGATYMNQKCGGVGVAGCFSFYPTKNITTLEGGMMTTNDDEIARKARLFREHCMTKTAIQREAAGAWSYDILGLGYNYRMNEVQAALGISQLRRVDEANSRRTQLACHYNIKLAGVDGIVLPSASRDRTHVYHLYVVRVETERYGLTRDALFRYLSDRGIGLSVHYTPLHLLTYYKQVLSSKQGDYPIAERAYQQVLSLPLFPTLTREQIDYVSDSIAEARKKE